VRDWITRFQKQSFETCKVPDVLMSLTLEYIFPLWVLYPTSV
jgi:hypothetical protein